MSGSLANIDKARQALANASTLSDILEIRDKAEAIRHYVKAQKQSLEVQNRAAEIKLMAERKAGELLASMDRYNEARDGKKAELHDVTPPPQTLDELGVSKIQSHRWQREADLPEDEFAALVTKCNEAGEELTQAAVLKAVGAVHVAQNSGENEWYTPPQYIEAARVVMGSIDLDPASSAVAQKTVKAKRWFGIDNDGLDKVWRGNVWLNPPYAKDLISLFVAKLKDGIGDGDVLQAVLLVNNATDTAWFHDIAPLASAACFIKGRISFHDSTGTPANKPLQGQVALYFGGRRGEFRDAFDAFGVVLAGME